MLTLIDIATLLNDIKFLDRDFVVMPKGDGFLIQLQYDEADVNTGKMERQKARKWYVSPHSTESEIVQTCLKAAITSMEHVVREHFTYKGTRVFSPHHRVNELIKFCEQTESDFRPPPQELCCSACGLNYGKSCGICRREPK